MNSHAINPVADVISPLSPITRTTVTQWISDWLAERDYDEYAVISQDTPFSEMGLSSIDAVELATELSQASGVSLDSTIAWHYPTPMALAGFIADSNCTAEPSSDPMPAAPAPGENLQHLDEQGMAELLKQLLGTRSPPR